MSTKYKEYIQNQETSKDSSDDESQREGSSDEEYVVLPLFHERTLCRHQKKKIAKWRDLPQSVKIHQSHNKSPNLYLRQWCSRHALHARHVHHTYVHLLMYILVTALLVMVTVMDQ